MTTIHVFRRFPDGTTAPLGNIVYHKPGGWRFVPHIASHRPSRKLHPSWEAALPRWIGYPDRCETRVVS